MNFIQIILRDAAPLGIELEQRPPSSSSTPARRRPPTVKALAKLSRAVCTSKAMIDPDLFRGAAILGVNGVKWNEDDAEHIFEKYLSDGNMERPVSIILMPKDSRGVEEAVNVNKRYDRYIELVFREQSTLGIQLDTGTDENVLKVRGLVKDTQSMALCQDCLLDPTIFEGATMVKIDGRGGDRDAIYQRLKCSDRPKAVLFELAPSAIDAEHVRNIRPPIPPPPRGLRDRRASLQMRDRAVFATQSVRKLSVEYQRNHNEDTLMRNVNESIRQLIIEEDDSDAKAAGGNRRNGLEASARSSLSASLKQLQVSVAEMEELNAQNEQAMLQHSSSSVGSEDTQKTRRGARARRVLQGLRQRRFKRRTESGRSIDEGPEQYSDSALDIDSEFESEEDKNKALEYLKQEAYQACLDAIQGHLTAFLSETPDCTYEEWVAELHPENAKSTRNLVRGKSIDHRFYVEDSDHRQLWNQNLGDDGQRQYVHIRDYSEDSFSSRPRPPPPKAFARSPPPRSAPKANDGPESGV